MQRKADAYEHPGTPPRTRDGSPGDSSPDDDLEFGNVAVVIAVLVILAILGIFIALIVLLSNADYLLGG